MSDWDHLWANAENLALPPLGSSAALVMRSRLEEIVARRERAALISAAEAIRTSVSYGFELRGDGSEDPRAAAYVEGLHDAYDTVRDLIPQEES